MIILFRFLLFSSWIFISGASVAKVTKLFGSVPEEQCMDIGCKGVKSVNYFTSCGQSIYCKDCRFESFKPAKQVCNEWSSTKFDRILLAGGSVTSTTRVGGEQFESLYAEWIDNKPIDLGKCQLESFNFNTAYSAFSNGGYTGLFSTVAFHLSIATNTPRGKKLPPIEFQMDLEETLEEINARGMNTRMRREKCFCPVNHSPVPFKFNQKKVKRNVTLVSRSFSIPLDRSEVYRPSEFRIKAKCKKGNTCDLSFYRICLRVSCSRMPESQRAQYMMVQNLLKNPPRAIDEPEEEEIEEEDEESEKPQATRASKPTEGVHISRKVPKEINKSLQLEHQIVFDKSQEAGEDKIPSHFIYLISGMVVLILVVVVVLVAKR
ncbi:signal peptide plus GPI anchored membrane protein with N-terminal multiple cysteines [Cryptosporidium felis]|nr:signal peptide plus GPI anchored membrane protein with N-terminal multiple cysteines [Cryptosporidium felis]